MTGYRAPGVAESRGEAPRLRSCCPTQARPVHARIYLRHVRLSHEEGGGGGSNPTFPIFFPRFSNDPSRSSTRVCQMGEKNCFPSTRIFIIFETRFKIENIREVKFIVSYRLESHCLGSRRAEQSRSLPLYTHVSPRPIYLHPFLGISLFRAWPYSDPRFLSFESPFLGSPFQSLSLSLSLFSPRIYTDHPPPPPPTPSTLAPFRSLLLRLSFVRRITAIENR